MLRSCIAVILSVSLFMTTLTGCSDQQESTEEVRKYYEEICPVPAYKAYLEKVFTNMPEEPIKIKDVSVTENGSLRVDVTDESLPYVGVQWRPL